MKQEDETTVYLKIIDDLLDKLSWSDMDLCGICAYYVPPRIGEDFTPCVPVTEKGTICAADCKKGIFKHYFTLETQNEEAD